LSVFKTSTYFFGEPEVLSEFTLLYQLHREPCEYKRTLQNGKLHKVKMKAFSVCLVFSVITATFAQDEHVLSSDVKVKAVPKRVQGANDPPASMDLRANFTAVKDEKKCRKLCAV